MLLVFGRFTHWNNQWFHVAVIQHSRIQSKSKWALLLKLKPGLRTQNSKKLLICRSLAWQAQGEKVVSKHKPEKELQGIVFNTLLSPNQPISIFIRHSLWVQLCSNSEYRIWLVSQNLACVYFAIPLQLQSNLRSVLRESVEHLRFRSASFIKKTLISYRC